MADKVSALWVFKQSLRKRNSFCKNWRSNGCYDIAALDKVTERTIKEYFCAVTGKVFERLGKTMST